MLRDETGHIRTSFLPDKYMNWACFKEEAPEIAAFLKNPSGNDFVMDMAALHWTTLNFGHKENIYTAIFRDETWPQISELLKISDPIKYHITEREQLNDNSHLK